MSYASRNRERCSGSDVETILCGFRKDGGFEADRARRPLIEFRAMQNSGDYDRIVSVKVRTHVSWREVRVESVEVVRDWRA